MAAAGRRRFQAIGTSPSGGGWGATIPVNADQIQLAYGTVPANFVATATVRAGIPANGIARDGMTIPRRRQHPQLRHGVRQLRRRGRHPAVVVHRSDGRPPGRALQQGAHLRAGRPPSGDVDWVIGVGVEANSASDLVNPVITDCLPPDIDLIDPTDPASRGQRLERGPVTCSRPDPHGGWLRHGRRCC